MKNYLLAYRYANALAQSIEDDADLEPADAALTAAAAVYRDNPELNSALTTPSIDVEERVRVLLDVLTEEHPYLVRRLAEVLLRRGRISLLGDVAAVFSSLVDRRLERLTADVRAAHDLSEEQCARLEQALSKFIGKTVRLELATDSELLGGVVARLEGILVDGSLRNRLERLRAALLAEES
ncbi:MAG: ATP synthase F1 subunit delta [Candidatus Hydrogenedentota bacterium]